MAEVPVRWSHDAGTKVNVAADGIRMFFDLLVIRWNALRGLYPRSRNACWQGATEAGVSGEQRRF